MKASELRIGNWVRLYTNHENFYEFKIEIADLIPITNKSGDYSYIPLTEQWLLDFGFKSENKNGWLHINLDEEGDCFLYFNPFGKGIQLVKMVINLVLK